MILPVDPRQPVKAVSKNAAHVTLSSDVYLAAKVSNLNISQLCEERLRDEIRIRRAEHGQVERAAFPAHYQQDNGRNSDPTYAIFRT